MNLCEYEGCEREGRACYLPDDEREVAYHFCHEHAHIEGFCHGCGGFFAGVGDFDFDSSGLCDNCRGDLGEDFDDEDEDDFWEDDE